jgi:hypothetical protein
MNKVLKDKWLAGLRDKKKYNRGRKRLRNGQDCFCPLGVLCDVYDDTKWTYYRITDDYMYNDESATSLPAELDTLVPLSVQIHILRSTDHGNASFEEIADYIEQVVPTEE